MTIIFWILFGLVIGWVATILDDPPSNTSLGTNMMLAIVGSIAGGVAGRTLEEGGSYVFGNISTLLSVMGGTLALLAAKGLKKRTTD